VGRRKLLLTSTVHRFEGSWWRASLSNENLAWTRKNLVKGADGKCAFERRPEFRRGACPRFVGPTLLEDWTKRVNFETGAVHPQVLVQMGERYDFREVFEEAQRERDPEIAPHVMFLKLAPENDATALGFIQKCGPLFLDDMTRKPIVWIDLDDFWRRHARFVAIAGLYEALDDCENLRNAVVDIADKRKILDAAGPAGVGMIPHTHKGLPFIRIVDILQPQDYQRPDQHGDPTWNHRLLRDHAREIICAELMLQTFEGIRSGWESLDVEEGMGFRPTRIVTSLWAAMWEMFGLDTWRGYGLRSCRICGKYFYSLQVNSECCNPEHQALWSKRQYAKKRRESEKRTAPRRRRQTKKYT
jgi:hypothetical protein